jgi:hypothetical protein
MRRRGVFSGGSTIPNICVGGNIRAKTRVFIDSCDHATHSEIFIGPCAQPGTPDVGYSFVLPAPKPEVVPFVPQRQLKVVGGKQSQHGIISIGWKRGRVAQLGEHLLCKRVRTFQTLHPLRCVFNVSNNFGESASRSK